MKVKPIVAGICIVVFLGFLVFDALFKEKAMKANEKVVKALRAHRNKFTDIFMIVFSALVYSEVVIFFLLFAFFLAKDKIVATAYICYISLGVYINSVSKLAYSEGRPFFYYDSINIIGKCEKGLGHPSGHAMMGLVLIILVLDWIFYEIKLNGRRARADIEEEFQNEDSIGTWSFSKIVAYMVGLLVVFTIGLSRVYLGAHSFEQVLSGWAYGVIYLIFHYYFGKAVVIEFLKGLGNDKEIWKMKKFFAFCFLVLLTLFALVLPIVIFEIKNNPKHRHNMTQLLIKNCGKMKFLILDRKILSDCGIVGTIVGIYFGAYFSKGFYSSEEVFLKQTLSVGEKTKRFLILLAFFVFMIAVVLLMRLTNEIFSIYIVGGFLNFMLFGFNFVFTAQILFKKFDLNYSGDFLKIEDNRRIMIKD